MTHAEPIAARELHSCYMDHVRAALIGGSDAQRNLLARINRAELVLAWIDPWLFDTYPMPMANGMADLGADRALLLAALHRQANDYRGDGLIISAQDCSWLASHLVCGVLRLATADRVAEAREAAGLAREAEREAERRRALDLQRWQAEAEARAMAPR